MYTIYMDTGGTFSDAVIVSDDGTFITGKASTTPEDLEGSFFNCIEDAVAKIGRPLKDILSETDLLGFGTTAGTNALITRVGGPNLGLITTKGFEDTTTIMRMVGRSAGLPLTEAMHIAATERPVPIIPRKLIKGVTERIDSIGRIAIPLYEDEVRQAVMDLKKKGVEGIAVITLWSFLNDAHEKRIKEIIQEVAPDMEISISSEVTLLIREYARFNSTIINLFIGRPVRKLFSKIQNRLQDNGYNKPLFAMQAAGGLSRTDVIQPITTLHSGPVGGLVGVEFFKDIYGCKNAMGSDVGGTSFDISVVTEEGAKYLREPVVSRFHLANPMREIISIGAGGGTIAHIDKLTRELRLGPQSAGSVPGPVCYGKGGTEPTVTDADVVMNRIDPDYFLGGKMKLDKQMAEKAIKEKIADPLGMDLMEAAHGICSIIDNIMASIISSTMGERGLDPEEFLLFGFGGAGPAHCAGYSAGLGFQKVIIPPYASTFSAFGASTADVRHRYALSPNIIIPSIKFNVGDRRFNLTSLDELPKGIVETFNRVNDEFEQKAYAEMQEEGFNKENIKMDYTIEARYGSQKWEIVAPLPITRIKNVEDMKELLKWYENEYERLYGSEAKFPEGGLEIITMALEASGSMTKPKITKSAYVGEDASPALKGERNVFFVNRFLKTKIYEMKELKNGNVINGPAIIEGVDTTVVVPEDRNITVDEYLNMVMN